jgi:Fibronectin type III domain
MSELRKTENTCVRRKFARVAFGIVALFTTAALLGPLSACARPIPRPAPIPPPSTPGDFHFTATTDSSVTFAWNPSTPGSGGSLVYEIHNDATGLILNVGNVTSYTWDEVEAGGTYSFHIIAISGNEASAPSPELTVTIPGSPIPPGIQPDAPVITKVSATSDTITVSCSMEERNGFNELPRRLVH